jgi:uncharacterized membrane protein
MRQATNGCSGKLSLKTLVELLLPKAAHYPSHEELRACVYLCPVSLAELYIVDRDFDSGICVCLFVCKDVVIPGK